MNKAFIPITKRLLAKGLLAVLLLNSSWALAANDFKPDLINNYLQREFDWAMLIDMHDMNNHFNYPESKLKGLTKVRVKFRSFLRGKESNSPGAGLYEEFWYHNGKPIGLKRYKQLQIDPERHGCLIVRQENSASCKSYEAISIANALIRLLVDLQLKQISASLVLVPEEKYSEYAEALRKYRFIPNAQVTEGQQMSIHLRAYPQGPDEYYFFKK